MKRFNKIVPETKAVLIKLLNKLTQFKLKRDYLVFMGFFMLSLVFWLLKSLNKNYETELQFPVRFTDKPKEVIFESELPKFIDITVRDAGFQLLQSSVTPTLKTLAFNVKALIQRRDRKLGDGHYYILTSEYKNDIIHGLPSTSRLLSISPDTLHVYISKQIRRKVPVRLLAKVSPGRQRLISGKIFFQPDSISVFGSGRIIDTLEAVYTNFEDFKNLQDTIVRNIALKEIKGVDFATKRVNVTIPVETFTEKTVEVPISALGIPDSLRLRAFPGIAKVSFFVGVSHFQYVSANDFTVFVKSEDIDGRVSGEVPLHFRTSQKWISNIRITPEEIDYLLELKP